MYNINLGQRVSNFLENAKATSNQFVFNTNSKTSQKQIFSGLYCLTLSNIVLSKITDFSFFLHKLIPIAL